jgi:hypothetical protein
LDSFILRTAIQQSIQQPAYSKLMERRALLPLVFNISVQPPLRDAIQNAGGVRRFLYISNFEIFELDASIEFPGSLTTF